MNCSYLKTQKNSLRKVFAVLLFSLFSAFTFGAAYTWKGTVDTNWNNADNWEEGTVPGDNAEIIVDTAEDGNDLVLTENKSFSKLEIKEGSRLDAGSYTVKVQASTTNKNFECYGTFAISITNTEPIDDSTGYVSKFDIWWGDNSFLELHEPLTEQQEDYREPSDEAALYAQVGEKSYYKNLFINLPNKTFIPYQNELYVGHVEIGNANSLGSGKLKLKCKKIKTNGNQSYTGLVTLLSDVIFDCGNSGSITFTNSNQQTENVKTVVSESENGEFTYSATFKGKRVQFGAGLGLKNLSVESDEIVFYSTKSASYSVETTQKQIYKHAINLNCNDNDVSQVTMTFKAEEFEMPNNIATTTSNGLSKYVVVFDTPVKLFDNTTINCKGITFNEDIICDQAGYNLKLTGCSESDIKFYGNLGQDNKLNNFDITTRGGCSLYIGQNGTPVKPVNIKAQSFSFKDSTSPAINDISAAEIRIISETSLPSVTVVFMHM